MIQRRLPFVAAAALVMIASTVAHPRAQSRVVVTPSIAAVFVYDDNLFYQSRSDFEAIWRLTSGLSVSRESQRSSLFADLNFDLERFRERPELSTPLARQNAMLRVGTQAGQHVTVGFQGGFDSTRAPTELNLTTGLLTGRRRAYRLYGGPSMTATVTPRTKITTRYDLNADIIPDGSLLVAGEPGRVIEIQAPASRLVTHTAGARVTQAVTPRHDFRIDYVGRWFVPMNRSSVSVTTPPAVPALEAETIVTHTGFIGWTFKANPAVKVDFAVGPRFRMASATTTGGFDGIEAEFLVSRQRLSHDVFLSYARTVTTAVGLTSLLDIDRAQFRAVYHPPFGLQAEAESGFYQSSIDDQIVRVVRVGGGLTIPLGGPVALGAYYAMDIQYGRFGIVPAPGTVVAPVPPGTPIVFADSNAPMRRGVAMLRLVIAPRLRPTPEEPPPGASPVKTPPVKRSDR